MAARVLTPPCAYCMQQGVTNTQYLHMGVRRACQLQGVDGFVLCEVAHCRTCRRVHHLPLVAGDGRGGEQYVKTTPEVASGAKQGADWLQPGLAPVQFQKPGPGQSPLNEIARQLGLGGAI